MRVVLEAYRSYLSLLAQAQQPQRSAEVVSAYFSAAITWTRIRRRYPRLAGEVMRKGDR